MNAKGGGEVSSLKDLSWFFSPADEGLDPQWRSVAGGGGSRLLREVGCWGGGGVVGCYERSVAGGGVVGCYERPQYPCAPRRSHRCPPMLLREVLRQPDATGRDAPQVAARP